MATVLEEYITEEQRPVVLFLWVKGFIAKDICSQLGEKYFVDGEEVETEVRKWLKTTVKRLLCCEFRRTGKVMGQIYCINGAGGYVGK
jgi:hypothetical protein